MKQQNDIWYASYGSNLSEKRFHCYIEGGKPKGTSKYYKGCADKTLPRSTMRREIHRELYFAKKSRTWDNGGVAFIKTEEDNQQKTIIRMYLITKDQFVDVLKQEIDHKNELVVDFKKAISEKSLIVKDNSWYGNIIFLGYYNAIPIFTFTHKCNISPITKPCESYLTTIIRGLKETDSSLTVETIVCYLLSKEGVKNNYSEEDLRKLIENTLLEKKTN